MTPDISRAIVRRGELVADGANKTLVVPWWSFTKTVLAAAALTLVRDGVLALDQPVDEQRYNLRQLLQHTAGFCDYGELVEYHEAVARRDDPWSVRELLQRCGADELRYPPGQGWRYSNIGYLKVRQLIERSTNMPLSIVLDRAVFAPVGIRGARLARERADLAGVAMGETAGYHPGWVYHGLVVGPLHEAALLLDRLFAGCLLPMELIREMRAGCVVGPPIEGRPFAAPCYGLGLMIDLGRRDNPAGHTGGGPGTSIAVYCREREGLAVVTAAFACCDDPGVVEQVAFGAG